MNRAVTASAPGKVILLGEHAVVFGKTAISVAVGLRLHCRAEPSDHFSLNGHPLSPDTHGYIYRAVEHAWAGKPLAFSTRSDFPSGSGLGSSAAVTTSTLAVLAGLSSRPLVEEQMARAAFDVESEVQGRASPIDTSTASHGRGILVDSKPGPGLLWHIQRDTREWYIHNCSVPQLTLVVGFTGVSAPTGPLVAKVKRYADKNTFAREVIDEIGQLSQEGMICLQRNDQERLGRLMTKDHRLLAILGVSSRELDKLVEAALPYSYGAKLTGAGGGGSMIALTDKPEIVAEEIRNKGGTPYIVKTDVPGVSLEE